MAFANSDPLGPLQGTPFVVANILKHFDPNDKINLASVSNIARQVLTTLDNYKGLALNGTIQRDDGRQIRIEVVMTAEDKKRAALLQSLQPVLDEIDRYTAPIKPWPVLVGVVVKNVEEGLGVVQVKLLSF
jgi:hypothetical protein